MMRVIDKCVRYGLAAIMALILFLMLLNNIQYLGKKEYALPNIALLGIDVLIFAVTVFCGRQRVVKECKRRFEKHSDKIVFFMTFFLLCAEMYIAYNIHFKTGWDGRHVWENAKNIAVSNTAEINNAYFSRCPNNLLITLIGGLILKINSAVGIFRGDDEYLALIFANCLSMSTACFLTYKILKYFVGKAFAFVGFAFFSVLLVGLSPWMAIYYTDAFGVVFPALILYVFIRPVEGRWKNAAKYAAVFLLSSLGYYIKPTNLIVTIAIFIVRLCTAFKKGRKEIITALLLVCGMVRSLVIVGKFLDTVYEKEGFVIDRESELEATHMFMMGLNKETNGVYAEEDVALSRSCQTAKERRQVNMEVSIQRLKDFGIIGYANHLAKKLLCVFSDGTFAWRGEGAFFLVLYDEPNDKAAPLLRSFYYEDGKRQHIFMTFEQLIWIFVLAMLISFSLLWHGNDENRENAGVIIMLSFIGIIVFELLFEVRARYIFTLIPIFCAAAAMGLYETLIKANALLDKASAYAEKQKSRRSRGK